MQLQYVCMSDQVNTDSIEEHTETVEGQAQADTTNIQSENQAGSDHAGSGEVDQLDVAIATEDNPSPTDRVNNIGDQDEYEAMKAQLQQNPNELDDAPVEAEFEEEEEQSPVTDTMSAEALEADQATETETESNTEEDEEDAEKRDPQFRFRPKEEVDAEAFRIFKAANSAQAPISMTEALSLARNHLGLPDPAQRAQSSDDVADNKAESEDDVFDGITQVEARSNLKELRQGQNKALREGDLDEAADFGEQIIDAEELIEVLGEREATASRSEESERSTQFEGSYTKAVESFPDFAKEDTDFFRECKEIDNALETTNDPRYYDANKPLLVAQMAARKLNVAPYYAGQKPAPVAEVVKESPKSAKQTTSPQPARTEKSAPLPSASGGSRTGVNTGATKDLQQMINAVKTPEQFAEMARSMGQSA